VYPSLMDRMLTSSPSKNSSITTSSPVCISNLDTSVPRPRNTGIAKLLGYHDILHRGQRFLFVCRDNDSLSCSKSRCLDNDRVANAVDVVPCLFVDGKVAILGGGDVVALHKVF